MKTPKRRPARQNARRVLGILLVLTFPASFYYFSPYLSVMGAIEGVITGSLIMFGMLFVSSLVVGRLFCAWLCPAGALMDLVATAVAKPSPRRHLHWLKYVIWAPWLGAIIALLFRPGIELGIQPGFATEAGLSVSSVTSHVMYLLVALLFFVLSSLLGRRSACHAICWMAPFMVLGRSLSTSLRLPAYRLQAKRSACSNCGLCDRNCPMGLSVSQMVRHQAPDHIDCILCGQCAENCPNSCLCLTWAQPQTKEPSDE
jgi:polyferredoxin